MADNDDENSFFSEGCVCLFICLFLLLVILLLCSISFVEPINYGLQCNLVTKLCDKNDVKEAGRYLIGPISYFIQFPRYQVTVEFSNQRNANSMRLKSRTQEGLEVQLSLAFQYQLIKEKVPLLYFSNNLKYEETFIRIARDTIMKSAGHYMANQYWTARTQINKDMLDLLNKELNLAYASVTGFQLLEIDLPDSFETSIVATQVEQQNQKLKQFEQTAVLIRKDIDILRSDTDQKINTINAQASADAYQIQQQAIAEQQSLQIDSESDVVLNIKGSLGLVGQELKKYFVYNELQNRKNKQGSLVIGLDNVFLK